MSIIQDDFTGEPFSPFDTSNPFPDLSPDHDIPLEPENQFPSEENLNISSDLSSLDLDDKSEAICLDIPGEETEKKQKKLNKEDLKTIPLPIFNCLYCANEHVTFDHLVSEYLSREYLHCVSTDDIKNMTTLIESDLYSQDSTNINSTIINEMKKCVVDNSEYLFSYYKGDTDYKGIISKIATLSSKRQKDNVNPINNKEMNVNTSKKKQINWEENSSNNFSKYLKIDLTRKIHTCDIDFEEEPFDIWNCSNLSSLSNNETSNDEDKENNTSNCSKESCRGTEIKGDIKKHLSLSFVDNNVTSYTDSTLVSSPNSKGSNLYSNHKEKNRERENSLSLSLSTPFLNMFKSIGSITSSSY